MVLVNSIRVRHPGRFKSSTCIRNLRTLPSTALSKQSPTDTGRWNEPGLAGPVTGHPGAVRGCPGPSV